MELPFFESLPELSSLSEAFDTSNYVSAPPDWVMILTDVVDSTTAISNGNYKEVNIAGAVGIVAVSNLFGHLRFPYVFGGDGVIMILPEEWASEAVMVLRDVATTVRRSFDLGLRIGTVSVREVVEQGGPVQVARTRVSPRYLQTALDGQGVEYAEELLKSDRITASDGPSRPAQTSGFTCRWQEIPSTAGETVAIIAEACTDDPAERSAAIRKVADLIDGAIGDGDARNPVARGIQRHARSRHELDREAAVHARGQGGVRRAFGRGLIRLQILLVRLVLSLRLPVVLVGKDLSKIPQDNIMNADFQKFDGRLKMILACSSEQRAHLIEKLDALEAQGEIRYGVHISDRAVMTCLIHSKAPEEVHFVDAADGGYANAARMLKSKE